MSESARPIHENIKINEEILRQSFATCDDLKFRQMRIGKQKELEAFVCYIEVNVGSGLIRSLGGMIAYLQTISKEELLSIVEGNAFGLSDAKPLKTMEEAIRGVLIGDAVLFVDGLSVALKMPDQGYPQMGVGEADTEKVVRGSNESFTESEKFQ